MRPVCRTLEAYTFLRPEACFVYDDGIASTTGSSTDGPAAAGKQAAQPKAAGGGGRRLASAEAADGLSGTSSRRLAAGKQAAGDGAKAQPKQQKGAQQAQHPKGKKGGVAAPRQQQPKQQKGGQAAAQPSKAPADPQAGSYSAAILAALRSESSIAAHQAVRALKAEVMNHNVAVAAAFMAETEAQYSSAERDADRHAWALRRQQRLQSSQSIR